MPEPVKKTKIQNLSSQINEIVKQIGDLSMQLAKELASESSEVSSGGLLAGV